MEKVQSLSIGTVFNRSLLEFENVYVEYITPYHKIYGRGGIEITEEIYSDEKGNCLDDPRKKITFIAYEAIIFLKILE